MKIFFWFLMVFLFASFSFAEPIGISDTQVKEKSKPIIESVIDSYNKSNYAKMAVYFGEIMFENFSQRDFAKTREAVFPYYGALESVEYIGHLTQLGDTLTLYRGIFEKSDGLIRLILSQEEGRIVILGLWFE